MINPPYRLASYVRVPMRYGFYAGMVSFALIALLYTIGRHPMLIPLFFDYRIPLLAIVMFFSLKEARDYGGMKQFFFWHGMVGGGALTCCYVATVSSLLYVYIIIDPEFIQNYITLSLEQLQSFSQQDIDHVGQANYERGIQLLKTITSGGLITLRATQSFIISIFVSIIVSVILRTRTQKES